MREVEEARRRVIAAARRWVARSRARKAGADHGQDDWYAAYAEDSQAMVDAVEALSAAEDAQSARRGAPAGGLREELTILSAGRDELRGVPSDEAQFGWEGGWREDGIDLHCTCPACPVQLEGTVDGAPAYFRERHGYWRFAVGPDPIGCNGPDAEHGHWNGETDNPSWMPHAEVKAAIRVCVEEWRRGVGRVGQRR